MDYNVMQNITLADSRKYSEDRYEKVEDGIFLDREEDDDSEYRMTLSYEMLNESEDNNGQYPLEDLLDEYMLYVSDMYEDENDDDSNIFKYEFAGELDDLKEMKKIIGKKVFYRENKDGDGDDEFLIE